MSKPYKELNITYSNTLNFPARLLSSVTSHSQGSINKCANMQVNMSFPQTCRNPRYCSYQTYIPTSTAFPLPQAHDAISKPRCVVNPMRSNHNSDHAMTVPHHVTITNLYNFDTKICKTTSHIPLISPSLRENQTYMQKQQPSAFNAP